MYGFARLDVDGGGWRQRQARAILALEPLFSLLTIAAAGTTAWCLAAVLGKQGDGDGFEKFNGAEQSVAAVECALAAGAGADGKLQAADGVAVFEDFGIGNGGIGHVHVDAGGAMETGAGGRATANGFVVAKAIGTE